MYSLNLPSPDQTNIPRITSGGIFYIYLNATMVASAGELFPSRVARLSRFPCIPFVPFELRIRVLITALFSCTPTPALKPGARPPEALREYATPPATETAYVATPAALEDVARAFSALAAGVAYTATLSSAGAE